jgi:hypothetical protein
VPKENVRLVTVRAAEEQSFARAYDARPTRTDVNKALRQVNEAAQTAIGEDRTRWEASRLYVYVSGHGLAPEGGKAAILMADADRDTLGENVELELYGNWYETSGIFREVVVFADCCREIFLEAPAALGPPFNRVRRPYGRTTRLMTFATGLAEIAWEPENPATDDERGFFTRALLDGLTGGPTDDTGAVTLETLAGYLEKSVEHLTGDAPRRQTCETVGHLNRAREVVLVRPGGSRHKRTVRIRFAAGDVGDVVVLDGNGQEVARRAAGRLPWKLRLDEGEYQAAPDDGGAGRPFSAARHFRVIGGEIDVQL